MRFLVRLAQPRTPVEERAAEPKVRMGELALCLELLADQVELVLDALFYPAQRTNTTRGALPDATTEVAPDVGGGAFRIPLAHPVAETLPAHARVVAAGDAIGRADRASPDAGETLCDAANAMRALLLQIKHQPLRAPTSNGVREERAAYAVEWGALPAESGRLH